MKNRESHVGKCTQPMGDKNMERALFTKQNGKESGKASQEVTVELHLKVDTDKGKHILKRKYAKRRNLTFPMY